ncbi:hypothetical protein CK203_117137 [Vitis vinifera]|uniref:Mediator complex subunit 15 KIX domain-containing protein n=1 Tax=Vitis vinifera TaxID=29760 RepID=A0A438C449_VITVI|nr:hypothetical protein CK203_117137 [Vitis vinifera]
MSSMATLKRHLPISGPEGLNELRKIVERFEERFILLPQARPHWMTLCTHECLFSMQVDGPRFDERSCEGLVATQADNRRHANKLVGQLDLAKIQVFDYRNVHQTSKMCHHYRNLSFNMVRGKWRKTISTKDLAIASCGQVSPSCMATCHSRISQYGIKIVELMDQSEEDTWKVKNILESGERIFCYGKVASCMRGSGG